MQPSTQEGPRYQNGKEWARAKDEMNSVGSGLHKMDHTYQNQYNNNNNNKKDDNK